MPTLSGILPQLEASTHIVIIHFDLSLFFPDFFSFALSKNINAFNKSSFTAFNRCAYACLRMYICVYVLKRNYFKDLKHMENESRTQPEKNVITDLADFIYLINHRLVVFLTAACRCQRWLLLCFFFLFSLSLSHVLLFSFSWWWFCASFYPKKRPYDIRWAVYCTALLFFSQRWTTQFIRSMTEWKCRRNPNNLLFV